MRTCGVPPGYTVPSSPIWRLTVPVYIVVPTGKLAVYPMLSGLYAVISPFLSYHSGRIALSLRAWRTDVGASADQKLPKSFWGLESPPRDKMLYPCEYTEL